MTDVQNTATFEEILDIIKWSVKKLVSSSNLISHREENELLQKLIKTLGEIGPKPDPRPPPREIYVQQWEEFSAGKREQMDRSAVRYLCWEPKVALHEKFIDYLRKSQFGLNPLLQSLVHSCHSEWDSFVAHSSTVAWIKNSVSEYDGPNRVLTKWKSDTDAVLGVSGTASLAEKLISSGNTLQKHLEEWYLEAQSSYVKQMVVVAAEKCRSRVSTERAKQLLFDQLLPWGGWLLSDFKTEIGNLILHREFDKIQNPLKAFVLSDKERLGDPRNARTRSRNWTEVPAAAVDRLIKELCREDIIFFFENVFPAGSDRQHRRDFWLQYEGRFTASRPLLCKIDRLQLRPGVPFGRLRASSAPNNSAFLLSFGDVTVVEFSRVGACYVYKTDVFQKMVGDYWKSYEFTEAQLKDEALGERVPHYGSWHNKMRFVLSRHGVRPGGIA